MRIAINKESGKKYWVEHKKINPHVFDDFKWFELHSFSKQEWECPFCGCDMVLRSFDKNNIPTPHWGAKNSHEMECEVFERIMDGDANVKINFLSEIVNTPREKYIDRLLMRLENFNKDIYEGAIFAIEPKDIKIRKFEEFGGYEWADINIGDPFKKGIAIKIRKSNLPEDGEELIMCFNIIREYKGESSWGKSYTKKYAYKPDYRYFKREKKEVSDGE